MISWGIEVRMNSFQARTNSFQTRRNFPHLDSARHSLILGQEIFPKSLVFKKLAKYRLKWILFIHSEKRRICEAVAGEAWD